MRTLTLRRSVKQRVRDLFQAMCFGAILSLAAPVGRATESLPPGIRSFLESHCIRCHGDKKQKGRFRIDTLKPDFANTVIADKWSEVAFRIKSAEMPPPEEEQPTAEEIGLTVDFLTERVREGAAERLSKRGMFEEYRLSRQEYAYTVYDLLGVVFDVEAPGTFSEDPRWHGIDRVGAMLSLAPSHVERYFEAADAVIELAFPSEPIKPQINRKIVGENKRQLLQLGEAWNFSIKHPGHYRLRIQASGLPAFTGKIPHLSIWHTHHKRSFDGFDLSSPEDSPRIIEFEGLYPAGEYSIRNHARTKKHANGGISLFRNEAIDASRPIASLTGRHRSPWTKVVDESGQPTMPLLLVDWIEIEGPLTTAADHEKRAGVIPLPSDSVRLQETALRRFAERAWRRPVTEREIRPYQRLVSAELEAGEPFLSAFRSGLSSILISHRFFNLEEGSPIENRPTLTSFELASRLSYFLWSSMPDADLFAAAESGDLHLSRNLEREFDRMIQDPKFDRFLDSFPKQWLQLHRVGMFQPDPELYPTYDPWLEESMIEETTRTFAEMFRRNLPLRETVDSDWSILNARLAQHYGLTRPEKLGFNRVQWKPDSGRGGILSHASILSLSSDGTRHRPVHRGAWISEAILGRTPPPPPPNVDPLEPVMDRQPKTTIRAKLEAHATDPNCASCHAKIDPLGLAFENFDAIGRWRDKEIVNGGVGANPPVDATGEWNGKAFDNATDFKRLLADDDEQIAKAFLEHLATYALRRVMNIDDKLQLQRIAIAHAGSAYPMQNLVRAFILSDLFSQR